MLLSTGAAYRLWAPSYDTDPNPLLALEARMARDLMPDILSLTIIDVGCGTGRSMVRCGARGAHIFGADPSLEMLAEARKKPGIGTRLVQAEASYLPFPRDIADLTVCSFALSYFEDLERSLAELSRVTKRTGRILISDLHPAAAASGWTRTFRVGDSTYEIAHAAYGNDAIDAACKSVGLQIMAERAAGFGEPERAIFVEARKEHVYSTLIGKPAVRVIVCTKV
jgi:SAM-dependent methyltransferase